MQLIKHNLYFYNETTQKFIFLKSLKGAEMNVVQTEISAGKVSMESDAYDAYLCVMMGV